MTFSFSSDDLATHVISKIIDFILFSLQIIQIIDFPDFRLLFSVKCPSLSFSIRVHNSRLKLSFQS